MGVRAGGPQRRPRGRGRGGGDSIPPGAENIQIQVTRQYLIIDADDTLWENNIYFERAFAEFVDFLNHSSLSPVDVRALLDEIETANARVHGYGSTSFGNNLRQCYTDLAEREICEGDLRTVMSFAERILQK